MPSGDLRETLPDVALPDLVDHPAARLELAPLPRVPLPVELELACPERLVRARQGGLAARAVMPEAAVHEHRDAATRIADVGTAGRTPPVEAIARMT